jgi:hypothetical protein
MTNYLMLITAGTTSTGGLAAFAVKKFFSKPDRNHQTNETGERQNENRDNGTENKQERSESFQSGVRS